MTDSSSGDPDPVEVLAEEFLKRRRQGEHPSLDEYIEQYPNLADEIRDVFPALVVMDEADPASGEFGRSIDVVATAVEEMPHHELGDYRIIREVGRGGMGVVFEAEQLSLGRHVALKVLPKQALLDSKQQRRFLREAKAAAKLHHTNIVPVFGVGQHDGLHYYAMQFIQGLGLDDVLHELRRIRVKTGRDSGPPPETPLRLRRGPVCASDMARSLMSGQFQRTVLLTPGEEENASAMPSVESTGEEGKPGVRKQSGFPAEADTATARLSDTSIVSSSDVVLPGHSTTGEQPRKPTYWRSVARIGAQVASALEYAHEQGILHRDVKPSNLLLDVRGSVWVTDFGLAKTEDQEDLTHTGDIIGTLRYMPPEAFEGRTDARSDVYSLGLTLYELLALRPAFDVRDRQTLMKRMTTEPPPRLDKLNADIPRDLVTIVHKAIDREAAHRYASAGDLEDDLLRFIEDEPIKARRIGQMERLVRWCRRNPLLAVESTVAAVALMAVTLLSILFARAQSAAALQEEQNNEKLTATVLELNDANEELNSANTSLRDEQQRTQTLLNRVKLQSAQLAVEKGNNFISRHEVHTGMMWLLEGLAVCPDTQSGRNLAHAVRVGIAAVQSGQPRLNYVLAPDQQVTTICYSPDGRLIATGSVANDDIVAKVCLWDAATGQVRREVVAPGSVNGLDFSPDGQSVVVSCIVEQPEKSPRTVIALLGLETGDLTPLDLPVKWLLAPAVFSPLDGGTLILVGYDLELQEVTVSSWNLASHQLQQHVGPYSAPSPATGRGAPLDVQYGIMTQAYWAQFSRDRRRLLVQTPESVQVWDTIDWLSPPQTLNLEQSLPLGVMSLKTGAFSPRGTRLLVGIKQTRNPDEFQMWDLEKERLIWKRPAPSGDLRAHFSPDGSRLLMHDFLGNVAPAAVVLRLFSAANGRPLPIAFPGDELPRSYTLYTNPRDFSPDGRHLAVRGLQGVRVWQRQTAPLITPMITHSGQVEALDISADGKTLFHADRDEHRLIDLETGRVLLRQEIASLYGSAISPDGQTILSILRHQSAEEVEYLVQLRESNGAIRHEIRSPFGLQRGVLSPEGDRLLLFRVVTPEGAAPNHPAGSRTSRGLIETYDVRTGRQLDVRPANLQFEQTISADGKWLASVDARERLQARGSFLARDSNVARKFRLTVQNLETGETTHLTRRFTTVPWIQLRFARGGEWLLAHSRDSQAHVFDLNDLNVPPRVLAHERPLAAAAFHPLGRKVLTIDFDNVARLWDIASGQAFVLPLDCHARVENVIFHPDGESFVTVHDSKSWGIRRWRMPRTPQATTDDLRQQISADYGISKDEHQSVFALPASDVREKQNQRLHREHLSEVATSQKTISWHERRAIDCLDAEDWDAALWHLDRLIEQPPDDERAHLWRVVINVFAGRIDDAEADLERLTEQQGGTLNPPLDMARLLERAAGMALSDAEHLVLSRRLHDLAVAGAPNDMVLRLRRARLHERLFNWDEAVNDYQLALNSAPENHWYRYKLGAVLLYKGELEAYRKLCHEMLQMWSDPADHRLPERTAKLCLLLPVEGQDYQTALKLIDAAYENAVEDWYRNHDVLVKGIADYRRGRFSETIERIDEAKPNFAEAGGFSSIFVALGDLFAAMAHHRLGETEKARSTYAAAVDHIEMVRADFIETRRSTYVHDWLFAEIARREAAELLGVEKSD